MTSHIVIPGDVVNELSNLHKNEKYVLGPGLCKDGDKVVVTKCGILKKKHRTYWVDNYQKRYVPVRNEDVIGIVTNNTGDNFKVDIGGSMLATISYLAFEGATKKNRPSIQIGDLIFAKLLVASRDQEPQLVCVDSHGKSNGLGILTGGFMIHSSLNLVRKILSPSCHLMKELGKYMKYEIAIGMNGRIWVQARSVKETIAVCNAISLTESMTNNETGMMCEKMSDALAGF